MVKQGEIYGVVHSPIAGISPPYRIIMIRLENSHF
jgi:hypothetical protein